MAKSGMKKPARAAIAAPDTGKSGVILALNPAPKASDAGKVSAKTGGKGGSGKKGR